MKARLLIIPITFLFLTVVGFAQNNFETNVSKRGTVAAPFLTISQGARATAMGSRSWKH